ncbi:VOC family protein [Serinicoccus sp. LYQ131]|uniref:VOC family protein n=1 Tax=Serinicoccus sp. LYQ131 TaxID=3378797 RepID=UPI003852BA4C
MATDDPTHHQLSTDPELADWRVLLGRLCTRYTTGDMATGAELVARVAEVADRLDHHPDIDLRYPHVSISTVSHDVGRLTARDRRLAVAVSDVARDLGLRAVPHDLAVLEIALDAMGPDALSPFWAAVLGYAPEPDHELADPAGRSPRLWFQQLAEPRTGRGRFHLDVTVPHDVAPERVAAALAAGGRLVTDEYAPSWWVLADDEGNEACVCTWQGRGGGDEDGVED